MNRALEGWRVLVPRAGDWGQKVARLLEAHGSTAEVVPLIEFAPPADTAPLDDALAAVRDGAYAWVVVTSATTLPYLARRGQDVASLLAGTPVAAVGPGTTRALARAGVRPELVPAGERSARGLVAEFPPPPATGGRVLLPHSDLAEPALADGLRAAGWQVDDVVAYRTVTGPQPDAPLREDLLGGAFHAVLLSSASTVTALLALLGRPPESTVVCCIGPRTQEAAQAAGLTVHVVPPAAAAEELVEALARYATAHAGTVPVPSPLAGSPGTPAAPDASGPLGTAKEDR